MHSYWTVVIDKDSAFSFIYVSFHIYLLSFIFSESSFFWLLLLFNTKDINVFHFLHWIYTGLKWLIKTPPSFSSHSTIATFILNFTQTVLKYFSIHSFLLSFIHIEPSWRYNSSFKNCCIFSWLFTSSISPPFIQWYWTLPWCKMSQIGQIYL